MFRKISILVPLIGMFLFLVSVTSGFPSVSANSVVEMNKFKVPEQFTEFSSATETILKEGESKEEIRDLTNLTKKEARKLSEDDYIEYQMQTGNFSVEKDGSLIIPDDREGELSPACIACAQGRWVVKKTSGPPSIVYGSWRTIASGWGPGTLSKTVSETRTNSYTGTLSASKSAINAAVGFNISSSKTVTVSYSGNINSGKQGFLQTRPVYKKYTVMQQYIKFGQVQKTNYVHPREFWITDNRIGY